MSEEANKQTVLRFVREVLDGGSAAAEREVFVPGARRYFPGREVVMQFDGDAPAPARPYTSFHTDVHHLFAAGDLVGLRLTHHVTFAPNARWVSRLGACDAGGKSAAWDATVVFRMEDGKIAEEWVNRDELHVLHQLGVSIGR